MNIEKFIDHLLPGNYSLTKSMEIGKINTSGTLWYTKKFLVWYYFIFLDGNMDTSEYITKIRRIFEDYIKTLDLSVQDSANKFFFQK